MVLLVQNSCTYQILIRLSLGISPFLSLKATFSFFCFLQVNWIRERLETPGAFQLTSDQKKILFARISRSAGFESFLARKYRCKAKF